MLSLGLFPSPPHAWHACATPASLWRIEWSSAEGDGTVKLPPTCRRTPPQQPVCTCTPHTYSPYPLPEPHILNTTSLALNI